MAEGKDTLPKLRTLFEAAFGHTRQTSLFRVLQVLMRTAFLWALTYT